MASSGRRGPGGAGAVRPSDHWIAIHTTFGIGRETCSGCLPEGAEGMSRRYWVEGRRPGTPHPRSADWGPSSAGWAQRCRGGGRNLDNNDDDHGAHPHDDDDHHGAHSHHDDDHDAAPTHHDHNDGPTVRAGFRNRLQHQQASQRAWLADPGRVRRSLAQPTTVSTRIAG